MFESRKLRIAALLGALLSLVLVIAGVLGEGGVAKHAKLRASLDELEAKNQRLRAENAQLTREVQALRTDPNYLQSVIRDELGWVKPDELVFIVPAAK